MINGLYRYSDNSWQILENSNGKQVIPILKETYMVYLNGESKYQQDKLQDVYKISFLNLEDSMVELKSPPTSISNACTVNFSVLKDDKYLYIGTDDGLQVIPISELGMPVKVDLD